MKKSLLILSVMFSGFTYAMEHDEKAGCWRKWCGGKNAHVGRLEKVGLQGPPYNSVESYEADLSLSMKFRMQKVQAIDQRVLDDARLFATAYSILLFAKKASKNHKKAKKRCRTFTGKPNAKFCSNSGLGLRVWNHLYGVAGDLNLITPWGDFDLISDAQDVSLREKIKKAVLGMKDISLERTFHKEGGFGIHQQYYDINEPHNHQCICLKPWHGESVLPEVAAFTQKQQEKWQALMHDYHDERIS